MRNPFKRDKNEFSSSSSSNMYINGVPVGQADTEGQEPRRGGRSFSRGFVAGLVTAVVVCGIVYVVGTMFGVLTAVTDGSNSVVNASSVDKIRLLEQWIESKYYLADEVTQEQLEDGLYKGLVNSLDDPYSQYYTEDEIEELQQSIEGTYSGIGAYIGSDAETGYPKITGVIADSPAEAAGLLADDIIYKVDGENTGTMDLDEVVSHVRGEKGTDVTLTIARSTEVEYLEITITRDEVNSPTVTSEVLQDDIGYLQITEFDGVTTDQFRSHLQSLYDQDIEGLILDLRNNPGGDVDVVTAIANEIIPEGLIFYMEDREGNRTEYTADGKNTISIPLVVLVNGNSASASEILTGAIQDSGCGTIVGTQTYGKGIVQSVYSLRDGTAVKLTIANYYTRNGNNIHKIGITPDIVVELDGEQYLEDGTDNQLQTAIETIETELD